MRHLSPRTAFWLIVALLISGMPLDAAETPASPRPLTVAVLDFDTQGIAIDDLGGIIGQTLTILLAGVGDFDFVDRASLEKTLAEHELNLSGLVETARAVQVGQLVGARLLVVGRVFQLGQRTFITAKLIGTETSLVDGVLVQGDSSDGIETLILELGQRLTEKLPAAGPRLVAQKATIDPLPALQEALTGRALPRVAVVITEEHLAERQQAVPDPAAETEVKRLLRSVGIVVHDVAANELAKWARSAREGEMAPWPQGLAEVDLVITGEAFSEFGARIGNLRSAVARVEINVIDRQRGEILIAERATTRAVDLAEHIAGKTALQQGGRSVALEILRYLDRTLPQATPTNAE